jgi:hypothetical protein
LQFIFADDNSYISIHAGTNSGKSKISLVLIDPIGRKEGTLPSDLPLHEISNCGYSFTRLGDPDTGPDEFDPETIELGCSPINTGTYTIKVYGLQDTSFWISVRSADITGSIDDSKFYDFSGLISSAAVMDYKISLDPTPGAPPPTITKIVTFQTLRDDFTVAQKLNQIGDDKFVNSLIRMVNIAEKIYNRCQQIKDDTKEDKHKRLCYRPVIAILELIKKRLEIVNKICDNPNGCKSKCKLKDECDEEKAFDNFRKENIKEESIKEFFTEWDKDEWHKHKKLCKRFVTDEALKIISEDIDWLIKSIDVEKDKPKDKLAKDEIKDLKSEK